LVALAGVLLLLPAFDVVEPLAQEVDHPLRRDLLPVKPESLIQRHLLAPAIAMGLVVLPESSRRQRWEVRARRWRSVR
jgi:hypothetical protein